MPVPSIYAPRRPVVNSYLVRERDRRRLRELVWVVVILAPLAIGLLTGKYDYATLEDSCLAQKDWLAQNLLKDDLRDAVRQLKPIANDLGVTRAQLAIAWTLHQPAVSSAITGATKISQLEDTLKAVEIELDEDVLEHIDELFPVEREPA